VPTVRYAILMARQLIDDGLWAVIEPLLPEHAPDAKGGRPRTPDRVALTGIVFVLRTGIPWEDLPQELGCSGMTCWNRLREWQRADVWRRILRVLLVRLHKRGKLDWSRAVVDSSQAPAKRGVRRPAPIPRTAAKEARNTT